MTRNEHMALCKRRALEYLDQGDIMNAVTSMLTDLAKHEETAGVGTAMAQLGMLYIMNSDRAGARRFIEGFN